jgi:hypothetical protein
MRIDTSLSPRPLPIDKSSPERLSRQHFAAINSGAGTSVLRDGATLLSLCATISSCTMRKCLPVPREDPAGDILRILRSGASGCGARSTSVTTELD